MIGGMHLFLRRHIFFSQNNSILLCCVVRTREKTSCVYTYMFRFYKKNREKRDVRVCEIYKIMNLDFFFRRVSYLRFAQTTHLLLYTYILCVTCSYLYNIYKHYIPTRNVLPIFLFRRKHVSPYLIYIYS